MERIQLHTDTPHKRDVAQIAEKINKGAVIIIPTDTMYALACKMSNRPAIDRIISITGKKEKKAKMSLLCSDISTVSGFTMPIDNHVFKTMKRYTPGPYTFILNSNNFTQKFFKNSRQEIGIRIVDTPILKALHEYLDEPLISTSLNMREQEERVYDASDDIFDDFRHEVDLFVDGGDGYVDQSTVLDCREPEIVLVREGKGPID